MNKTRHTSRTGVVDRIEHDDPKNLPVPVVIVLMHDEKIELYAAPSGFGGLEEYAGVLQSMYKGSHKQLSHTSLASIMGAIRRRVEEQPMSYRSHYWLKALYPSGLLGYAEDHLPPR